MERIDQLKQELERYSKIYVYKHTIDNDIQAQDKQLVFLKKIIPLLVPPESIAGIAIDVEIHDKSQECLFGEILTISSNVNQNIILYEISPKCIPYLKDVLNMFEYKYNELSDREKLFMIKLSFTRLKKDIQDKINFLREEV